MKNKSSLSGEISRLKEENVRLVQENDILKNQLSAINRRIAKLKQEIKDWQQATQIRMYFENRKRIGRKTTVSDREI